MTDKSRREAAIRFRHLLDSRVHRKDAITMLKKEFNHEGTWDAWKRSLYRYCKKFNVKTN